MADDVIAPSGLAAPMHAHANPKWGPAGHGHGLGLEALLEGDRGFKRGAGVWEPEKQAIAQLLYDSRPRWERRSDDLLLAAKERKRFGVSAERGEFGEADNVCEQDGALDCRWP